MKLAALLQIIGSGGGDAANLSLFWEGDGTKVASTGGIFDQTPSEMS